MIAMNTALLTNEEPLSRCSGKGADVVNNGKTTDPIIAHKPVSTTDGKPCQPAKAARTVRKPAAPRKKRYDEEDLVAFGENACMLRGAAEAILDMFHALYYCDDDQKQIVDSVKESFLDAAIVLANAEELFEENIPFKVLDKRRKTFSALVEIDEKDSDVLAAFTAINAGRIQWDEGKVYIDQTRYSMATELLNHVLESAKKSFYLAADATSNPSLAATLASMKGGMR